MKYLRRVGFVSCLLIVGVLGGLLAPHSSEAVPTVTLKVDSGNASSILITTSLTCTDGNRAGRINCAAHR
jgi:hypothetical protein